MVKKVLFESKILLFRSKLAKVSVWHKISLLAYTEVSNHCKCIFNGCKIVSYHGFGSMSKVMITREIEWKILKQPQKLVCDIYAYTSIFLPWLSIIERKCQKPHIFLI